MSGSFAVNAQYSFWTAGRMNAGSLYVCQYIFIFRRAGWDREDFRRIWDSGIVWRGVRWAVRWAIVKQNASEEFGRCWMNFGCV